LRQPRYNRGQQLIHPALDLGAQAVEHLYPRGLQAHRHQPRGKAPAEFRQRQDLSQVYLMR
jgi:hypothetical protein